MKKSTTDETEWKKIKRVVIDCGRKDLGREDGKERGFLLNMFT